MSVQEQTTHTDFFSSSAIATSLLFRKRESRFGWTASGCEFDWKKQVLAERGWEYTSTHFYAQTLSWIPDLYFPAAYLAYCLRSPIASQTQRVQNKALNFSLPQSSPSFSPEPKRSHPWCLSFLPSTFNLSQQIHNLCTFLQATIISQWNCKSFPAFILALSTFSIKKSEW